MKTRTVEMDVMAELAETLTEYIVGNYTNAPLWKTEPNGDVIYHDEAQDIFNHVLDVIDDEVNN